MWHKMQPFIQFHESHMAKTDNKWIREPDKKIKNWNIKKNIYPIPAIYEFLKYLSFERCVCVKYFNETCP